MPLPENDSGVGYSFGLEVDGVQIQKIQEISGLKMEQDVIELKQNDKDGKYTVKKLPGRPKAGELTVTRPLSEDNSFKDWIKDSQFGKMGAVRKGGSVIIYDYENGPVARYNFTNAWPKSLEMSSLKAGDTSVLTEKLVITYETLEAE
ncbi:phage tail protein [Ornithinicoccus hortensis]|uniref:Phage tail-like protein n=1 Tax=Ornithinicoccus hortensis TaxID=82346 RepID=A0A542YUV3_9MICO|nr:phage tail protein [Ornithinicoccus hortensis]TQL51869.1 phage tail-like protein [Ornithinicoccus hortensis]